MDKIGIRLDQMRWLEQISFVASKIQGRKILKEELIREAVDAYINSYRGLTSFLKKPLYKKLSDKKRFELNAMAKNQKKIFGNQLVKELSKRDGKTSAKKLKDILNAKDV